MYTCIWNLLFTVCFGDLRMLLHVPLVHYFLFLNNSLLYTTSCLSVRLLMTFKLFLSLGRKKKLSCYKDSSSYFGYKIFIRYMYYEYFLSVCYLPVYFLKGIFEEQGFLLMKVKNIFSYFL